MFNAITLALENRLDMSLELRQIVASVVLSYPDKYNESVLGGETAHGYANWIMKYENWGGALDLEIISEYYSCEIVVIEIGDDIFEIFGDGKQYQKRIYLLYTGTHYDLFVKNISVSGPLELDIREFSPLDE